MHKIIQLFVVLLLIKQLAAAQERQIKILNPDGTPATDAKVVAVLAMPGGIVDQDLKPLQMPNVEKQTMKELVNENGAVTQGDAKAIVASNEQGFLFLPASAFGEKAKLREWAHVELDVSTVPENKRADVRLNVMWTNSLQGMFVRPKETAMFPDRFTLDSASHIPQVDWRFDPLITWTHNVHVATQSLRVPPGEIQISLVSNQQSDDPGIPIEISPGAFATTVGLWQVPGGTVQRIALPEFGILEGMILTDTTSPLPDWGKSGSKMARFVLKYSSFPKPPPILRPSGSNDEYFSKLASDQGFNARRATLIHSMTTTSDGRFRFPLVPVGSHSIGKLIDAPELLSGISGQIASRFVPLKPDGDRDTTSVVVSVNQTTMVDVTDAPYSEHMNQQVPNDNLFFEPDVYSTPDLKPDTATLLIQNWLRTAKDPSDQTELRKLLLDHLQQEFDANQKSRQAEIERLQQLLVKSKEWLDQRQQRRNEIIKKRIDELLQQQALPKAEASGGR